MRPDESEGGFSRFELVVVFTFYFARRHDGSTTPSPRQDLEPPASGSGPRDGLAGPVQGPQAGISRLRCMNIAYLVPPFCQIRADAHCRHVR